MPKMKSLRTFTLRTTTGHVIGFEAGTPQDVPDVCVSAAMEKGCVPINEADIPFFEDLGKAKAEFVGDVRRSIIYLAVKALADENNAKNFDGAGNPKVDVVAERVGFQPTRAEVVDLFRQHMSKSGDAFVVHPQAQNALRVIEAASKRELLELCEELSPDISEQAKGLVARDLRKLMLTKVSGIVA